MHMHMQVYVHHYSGTALVPSAERIMLVGSSRDMEMLSSGVEVIRLPSSAAFRIRLASGWTPGEPVSPGDGND